MSTHLTATVAVVEGATMSDAGLGDARFLLLVACAFVMGLVGTLASGALLHLG